MERSPEEPVREGAMERTGAGTKEPAGQPAARAAERRGVEGRRSGIGERAPPGGADRGMRRVDPLERRSPRRREAYPATPR